MGSGPSRGGARSLYSKKLRLRQSLRAALRSKDPYSLFHWYDRNKREDISEILLNELRNLLLS